MNSFIKTSSVLILVLFTSGCVSNSSKRENAKKRNEDLKEERIIHDLDQLIMDFPKASLVPFTLKSIGAQFDIKHINPLDKITNYKNNRDKMALNMGVYASDISYLAAYGYEKKCIEYLQATHSMAEFLGDSTIYSDEEMSEFIKHIISKNDEKISKILSNFFIKASIKMEKNHHLTGAGLALTGSFIEGLYQAVITIEKFPETAKNEQLLEPLVKIIFDEEKALLDIIKVLNSLPFDRTISGILIELSILDRLYKDDLKTVEDKMKNNPNFIVTKNDMRDITKEVKRIRKEITE